MSRVIDFTDPDSWTADEVQYLRDRPWLLGRNGLSVSVLEELDLDEDEDEDEVDEAETSDYEGRTNDELRTELSSRGLSVSGNKEELIARLVANDEGEDDEDEDEDEDNE